MDGKRGEREGEGWTERTGESGERLKRQRERGGGEIEGEGRNKGAMETERDRRGAGVDRERVERAGGREGEIE